MQCTVDFYLHNAAHEQSGTLSPWQWYHKCRLYCKRHDNSVVENTGCNWMIKAADLLPGHKVNSVFVVNRCVAGRKLDQMQDSRTLKERTEEGSFILAVKLFIQKTTWKQGTRNTNVNIYTKTLETRARNYKEHRRKNSILRVRRDNEQAKTED